MNIAFIGARGAGKSKISRKLGKETGRVVLSTDTLISYEAAGETISNIVQTGGWKSFRDREYEILKKICSFQNVVVDCGGGILVEAPQNENDPVETFSTRKNTVLKNNTKVIYIRRGMDWLLKKQREETNHSRPDLIGNYMKLIERRLPWYEACADFILDMEKIDIEDAVDTLLKRYPPAL